MICESVKSQSKQIFQNIDIIFDTINDKNINDEIGAFPIWKQIYHLLHSIDQNFIDPNNFAEPMIHSKYLNILFLETDKSLSRDKLFQY